MKRNWWKLLAIMFSCYVVMLNMPNTVMASDSTTVQSENEETQEITIKELWDCVFMDIQELSTLFKPSTESNEGGWSMGNEDGKEEPIFPQPGPESTLLPDYKTRFSWAGGSKYKQFTIIEEQSGKIVCKKKIEGKEEIFIIPQKENMSPNCIYLWGLDGDNRLRQRRIRLLNVDLGREVQKGLKAIANKKTTEAINYQVLQAACLIAWSEKSGDKVDMYWLGYDLLMKPEMKELQDEASINLRKVLLDACRRHLIQRLP